MPIIFDSEKIGQEAFYRPKKKRTTNSESEDVILIDAHSNRQIGLNEINSIRDGRGPLVSVNGGRMDTNVNPYAAELSQETGEFS